MEEPQLERIQVTAAFGAEKSTLVSREAICFECGCRYMNKVEGSCPRCGETRIFIASLHAENYDITKDPDALFKMRIYGILALFALLITVLNLTH